MARSDPIPVEDYDYEALSSNSTPGQQMLAGAFAGIAEHSVMYPVDLMKVKLLAQDIDGLGRSRRQTQTRMQVINPSPGGLYTGISNAFSTIARVEGFKTLWRGISSVILGAGPAHAVQFATYEAVKRMLSVGRDENHHPFVTGIAAGAGSLVADALMNPFDVIKQRMQVHGSSYQSIAECARGVYRSEGFSAFYVSYPTTVCMNLPYMMIQFASYDSLKKLINPNPVGYDPGTHVVAGGLAGAMAAGVTTPLDVARTLLQTRGESRDKEIKSVKSLANAFRIIKRQHGWAGFYRGFRPRIVQAMPSTAICWGSYELAKSYLISEFSDKYPATSSPPP